MIRTVLWVLAVAVVVHVGAVMLVPAVVMHMVMRGVAAHVAANTPWHTPQATADVRTIPLPSPDLLYSVCMLDVSRAPVQVSVTPGRDYMSLAVFDLNTDNVFVASDRDSDGKPIELLVAGPNSVPETTPPRVRLVRLDSPRGLLLLRALAATPEMAARSDAARRSLVCEAANPESK